MRVFYSLLLISVVLLSILLITPLGLTQQDQRPLNTEKQNVPLIEDYKSPFEVVSIITADAITVAAANDINNPIDQIVYISLHNVSRAKRDEYRAIVDFVINSLNTRTRELKRTTPIFLNNVPIALRVNLKDYNIRKEVWIKLLEKGSGPTPLPEPYFNSRLVKFKDQLVEEEYETTEKKPTGRYIIKNGQREEEYETIRVKKKRTINKSTKAKEEILAPGPFLALEPNKEEQGATIAKLIELTQNKVPVARADWFITFATWPPLYYELIGLKLKEDPKDKTKQVFLEKDFEVLAKVDLKLAEEDILAGIADTKIVTLHNRIIQRFNTVTGLTGGYYWRSKDTDTGIDDEDYLNTITDFANPKIKAQEIITNARNGLHFYALTDANGILLSVAAANIAIQGDQMPVKWQDKQIYAGRNCMTCHAGGQIFVKDKVRIIAQDKIGLFIADKTKDQEVAIKVREAFSPKIKPIIDVDNLKYTTAVKEITGLDSLVVGKIFEDIVQTYYYEVVTLEKAALECGIPPEKLLAMLKEGVGLDYSLTAFLQNPPEGTSRIPWERQGYASLMQFIIGYKNRQK